MIFFINNNSDISQKICRICYQEEEDDKNPLIQPCLCSGSLKEIYSFNLS